MPSTARRTDRRSGRETLRSERRGLVLRMSMVLGIFAALPWALSHHPEATADTELAQVVVEAITSVLLRAGVGLLGGLAVGVLLCLTVPGLRRRA